MTGPAKKLFLGGPSVELLGIQDSTAFFRDYSRSFELVKVGKLSRPELVLPAIEDAIAGSDACLFFLMSPNYYCHLELGIALALKKPTAIILANEHDETLASHFFSLTFDEFLEPIASRRLFQFLKGEAQGAS